MKKEQFLIDSSFSEISILSSKVRSFLLKFSIHEEIINAVELSLVEALNNVVEHSYKMQKGNRIELDIEIVFDKIIVQLCDWGIAKTNLKKAELKFDPNDIENLPEGGMGLFIIEQLMDETEYYSENGKNTFVLTKSF